MKALTSRIILVVGPAGESKAQLVAALEASGADTVLARTPADALDRIRLFDFDGAVIDGSDSAHAVALRLRLAGVPFCVRAQEPPQFACGEPVAERDDEVPGVLAALLAPASGSRASA